MCWFCLAGRVSIVVSWPSPTLSVVILSPTQLLQFTGILTVGVGDALVSHL